MQEKKPRDTIFKIIDIIFRTAIVACMIVQLRINYRSFQRDLALQSQDLALQRQLNSVQEDVTEITNDHLEVLGRMNQCLRLMIDFINNLETQ